MRPRPKEQSDISRVAELTLDILPMGSKYYFYIPICEDGTKYYGYTKNSVKRFGGYSKRRVQSTRDKRPVKLTCCEEFDLRSKAIKREKRPKNGKTGKKTVEKPVSSFPNAKCQGLIQPFKEKFKEDEPMKIH